VFTKTLSLGVFRINQQRIRRHLLACLQAPVNGAPDQNLAQAGAKPVCAACQASHAKAGNRVSGEFFPFSTAELLFS